MYQVIFSKRALKSLKKIPKAYQQKITDSAKKLKKDPFSLDLKKMESFGQASHRLRLGSYRIFLQINNSSKEIIIADIRRRTTQTY